MLATAGYSQQKVEIMKELSEQERHVIIDKGTEAPFTGKYYKFDEQGTYLCKNCDAPLYRSTDKFDSGCGWPSFDDQIDGAVTRTPDKDGRRTEIVCTACGAHLGHVFEGEGFTVKNTRHCVNSISIDFQQQDSAEASDTIQTAIYAGGCFWGVEHLMQQVDGVLSVESGYIGGHVENPSYQQVCTKQTGHAEAVRVTFDASKTDYETLTKMFFEIHDPTQADGQGPDLGPQYRSEIFYLDQMQKQIAQSLIDQLKARGYDVVTGLTEVSEFYPAEDYHQDYYQNKGTEPYCHFRVRRF